MKIRLNSILFICLSAIIIGCTYSCGSDNEAVTPTPAKPAWNDSVITLTEAGTLSKTITPQNKYDITKLKILGPLNGSDIQLLRDMAGADKSGSLTSGKLEDLNLSGARIVSGGEPYYSNLVTSNDTVGSKMFYNCKSLKAVSLPDSVKNMGDNVFEGCDSIKDVSVTMSGVAPIGQDWEDKITILNLTEYWNDSVVVSFPNLRMINVDKNNENYCSVDGALLSAAKTVLFRVPVKKKGDYQVPNTVKRISVGAFDNCSELTSITFSTSTTSYMTTYMGHGKESGVPYQDGLIIYNCTKLKTVTFPVEATGVDKMTYPGCTSLENIFSPSYASIKGVLFSKDMKTLIKYPPSREGAYEIPEGVTAIGDHAFEYCKGLTSIKFPDSLTYIGLYAFQGCTGLTSLVFSDNITAINRYAFDKCENLTSIVFPKSLEEIGSFAFEYCPLIETLTFPATLTFLGKGAFWSPYAESKLKTIYCYAKECPRVNYGVFPFKDNASFFSQITLHAPKNAYYADNWGFINIIYDL